MWLLLLLACSDTPKKTALADPWLPGPYQVGVARVPLETDRDETWTPAPSDRRVLPVEIWYPTEEGGAADRAETVPTKESELSATAVSCLGSMTSAPFVNEEFACTLRKWL